MRKLITLFTVCAAVALFAASAQASGPCCSAADKAKCKSADAVVLSMSELEDGKTIEVGDGTLTMSQDGDNWTFKLTDKDGAEKSVFTINPGEDGDKNKCIKIMMTGDGSDVKTMVVSGDAHAKADCMVWVGDKDGKMFHKEFKSFHGGGCYRCPECGLCMSMEKDKDKGAYVCPNDGTEMTKMESGKSGDRKCSYVFISDDDKATVIEKEVEVE